MLSSPPKESARGRPRRARVAQQFLFGYDDGHRLICGSTELAPETHRELLRATDAAVSGDTPPLVTGMPVRRSGEYAFCVTWPAPEARRAGAVWGHALTAPLEVLQHRSGCDELLRLPRRPVAVADPSRYRRALPLDGLPTDVDRVLAARAEDREAIARIAQLVHGAAPGAVIVEADLGAAARALLALWRAQWPALRTRFSFRTRETVGDEHPDAAVTVARAVRGAQPAAVQPEPWARALADAVTARSSPLLDFLWAFGPLEPADPRRLGHLTELWTRVAGGDAYLVRAQLERHWPAPKSGGEVKQALFGGGQDRWWRLDERTRVKTVMDSHERAWDTASLQLRERARAISRH